MKPRNYILSIIVCLFIIAFAIVSSSCKSNDVSKNREAYEESIGAGSSSDGGDSGGDSGDDGGGSSSGDDHGNSSSDATYMSSSDSESGNLETGGDEDWFYVYLSSSGDLSVYSTGSTDVKAYLYDSYQAQQAYDDDGAGYPNFSIEETLSAGYYYIKVQGVGSSTTGSYTIYTSFTADTSSSSDSGSWDMETYPSDLYNTSDSDANWFRTTNDSYAGSYSLQSGDIDDNQKSCFYTSGYYSSYSFYYKASTESCCDKLKLYIDDSVVTSNGYANSYWSYASGSTSYGYRTFKWCFEKDGSITTGDDAIWIDNITLN